ncbi:glucosamine-6-phosphate deaminase [Planctomycetes bacterium K23_9]|uniref:Glucosamine-6-phosphate deaminase n=1 Tax=Stieleria marina TaxID=1930275 RepID=A0A517NUV7_9BACT|nr:Glucosamine-6-phosphate deaminase 1 [Planctomycetes bacterium K23_9]
MTSSDPPATAETTTPNPNVLICDNAEAASLRAAKLFAASLHSWPDLKIGLATGGTPVEMYAQLVRFYEQDLISFAEAKTFNLDEYVGLAADHPQSYRSFMEQQLFSHVNLDPRNAFLPNGMATDVDAEISRYEQLITDSGGIDLQLLGIGHNGHIAFNEPGSAPDSRTRLVDLTERTIASNARFFDSIDDVPKQAITMGIGTILEAKAIVLLALGSDKADAVRLAIEGEVSASHPASFLQTHANVTYVLDEAAAKGLSSALKQ